MNGFVFIGILICLMITIGYIGSIVTILIDFCNLPEQIRGGKILRYEDYITAQKFRKKVKEYLLWPKYPIVIIIKLAKFFKRLNKFESEMENYRKMSKALK